MRDCDHYTRSRMKKEFARCFELTAGNFMFLALLDFLRFCGHSPPVPAHSRLRPQLEGGNTFQRSAWAGYLLRREEDVDGLPVRRVQRRGACSEFQPPIARQHHEHRRVFLCLLGAAASVLQWLAASAAGHGQGQGEAQHGTA